MARNRPFFDETESYLSAVDRLNNLLHAETFALHTTHRSVHDYWTLNPNLSSDDLHRLLAPALRLERPKPDFRAFFEVPEWDALQDRLAPQALIGFIGTYESWLASLGVPFGRPTIDATFQGTQEWSAEKSLSAWVPVRDEHLHSALVPMLSARGGRGRGARVVVWEPKASDTLDNLFKVFRLFKNIRNTLVHSGGRPDDRVLRSAAEVGGLAASDCGNVTLPAPPEISKGREIRLSLHTVLGFVPVIESLALSIETHLAASPVGAALVRQRVVVTDSGRRRRGNVRSARVDATAKQRDARALLRTALTTDGATLPAEPERASLDSWMAFLALDASD